MNLRGLATLPDRLVTQRLSKRGFALESIIVLLFSLLGALGYVYVAYQSGAALEAKLENLRFEYIGAALQPLAVLLVLWVGYTVVPHLLAGLYQGRGRISRLFRGVAWALIPIGIWLTIRSIVIYVLFLDYDFPSEIPSRTSAAGKFQFLMENGLKPDFVYTATLLFGVLFVIWSGYLLSIAVAKAKNISEEDARKVAAVPTLVSVFFLLWVTANFMGLA